MHILFKTLHYENFLGCGSSGITLNLNQYETTLITGKNGSGKSSWLDALCYVLFNKPNRAVTLPALVNSINGKKLIVEVEFSIGTINYKVRRGAKPALFEIFKDCELVPQPAANADYQNYLEHTVLGMDYKTFCQLVIISKANYTPFMKLSPAVRRDRIETFLDCTVFTTMADLNKKEVSESKLLIKDIETEYAIHKNKIDVQESYVKTLSDDNSRKIEENQSAISTAFSKISELEKEIESHQESVSTLSNTITDHPSVTAKLNKLSELSSKLKHNRQQLVTEISFFNNNDDCPTCKQTIDASFKSEIVTQKSDKQGTLDDALSQLATQIDEVNVRIKEIISVNAEITSLSNKIRDLNSEITTEQRFLIKLQKELTLATTEGSNLDTEKTKLREYAMSAMDIMNRKNDAMVERQYIDMCTKLLKDDAIKATVVGQFLPIINKLLAKYMDRLEFFVSFALDESFNESILSRDRDLFTYDLFSEGEKSKIDLALLFTWITITQLKNTVSTNILVFDETLDSGVDTDASALIVEILLTDFKNKNTMVISHYPTLYEDHFEKHTKFVKVGNYSTILD